MDPLAALSIAGTIVQFVDYGTRLLSNTHELYRSSTGTLEANNLLELVTIDLQALITKLRASISVQGADQEELSFQRLCDQAAQVAQELLGRLDNLKIKSSKKNPWESFQKAIKSAWSEREITDLKARLLGFREVLDSRLLFSIRYTYVIPMGVCRENIATETMRASSRFDNLDRQTQQILISILESSSATTSEISRDIRAQMKGQTIAFAQILSRIESLNQNNHRTSRSTIFHDVSAELPDMFRSYDEEGIQGITADIEMLDVSDAAELKVRKAIHNSILESLRFPTMSSRYDDVLEAHPQTFEWALEHSPKDTPREWSNLANWLEGSDGVYWISGKAGTGKSTLMKHMYDDHRTYDGLKVWAKGRPLCIATFFFWNSGTKEQKSLCGLLRALLVQILKKYPDLSPIILPATWASLYSNMVSGSYSKQETASFWSVRELMTAFKALIHQKSVPIKVFFLIDGLDEFDGDHEEIARLFQNISNFQDIKVCLSSRPWVVFERIFENCPSLRLQHLTYHDIECYVESKLMSNDFFQILARQEPKETSTLVQEIVDKADGVFLWVKLVVMSLLNGIRNKDEISHLWTRLRLLPRELEPLYKRLLDLIEPLYWPWVSKAFQLLRNNLDLGEFPFGPASHGSIGVTGMTVAGFYLAMNEQFDTATILRLSGSMTLMKELVNGCRDTVMHLTARCAGLLEVSNFDDTGGTDSHIVFFHRTVRDFLYTDSRWSELKLATAQTEFNPSVSMMRSCISQTLINYSLHNKPERYLALYLDQQGVHVPERLSKQIRKNLSFCSPALYDFQIPRFTTERTKEVATNSLRYLLPEKDCYVKCGLPLPSVEMVSLLLELGADPNESGLSQSPWGRTLQFLMDADGEMKLPRKDLDKFFDLAFELPDFNFEVQTAGTSYDARPLHLRYLEIMKMLVEAGADPSLVLKSDCDKEEPSPLEIIESSVGKLYPIEAAPLIDLLRVKLHNQEMNRSRKREQSMEYESDNCKIVERQTKKRRVKKK
ncbi:hypothetical protein HYFRA_00002084 [Hymenoscyphus fraxineus]|uniref:NACHT domain-containing protein n=1 Tax=Hymenoscyphus fraxineus TaxID=746836 RepID=A0A9N9KL53_9HELO|nr:hypothetical protein HYFRA_00002084 [Hymenoscyphus fraxineus]